MRFATIGEHNPPAWRMDSNSCYSTFLSATVSSSWREAGSPYQHSMVVSLLVPPFKRSMAVFEAMLMMRYIPGWVLDGGIPVDVEEEENAVEEAVEDIIEETELEFCCAETFLFLSAAESPPPTPPPIAPPNSTSTIASVIQNKRLESPHMRCNGFSVSSLLGYGGDLDP